MGFYTIVRKKKFPNIHELTGKLLGIHKSFTIMFINRKLQLFDYPDSLELYDDLEVAYDKIKRMAINTMKMKDSIQPGLYETYANGTSIYTMVILKKYLLLKTLNKLIFREIFQKHLVDYLIEKLIPTRSSLAISKNEIRRNFIII